MEAQVVLLYSWIALFGIEILLALLGVGCYYRIGIPVFRRTIAVSQFPNLPAKALSEAYENEFQSIITFVTISTDELGYHEWGSPLAIRYRRWSRTFPVMHGLIRFDRLTNQVCVTCYFNWFFLGGLGFALWLLSEDWHQKDWGLFMHWEWIIFLLFFVIFFVWFPYLNFSSVCWFLKDRKY
jgi:hypothetical protein